jgi:hypothetical protein
MPLTSVYDMLPVCVRSSSWPLFDANFFRPQANQRTVSVIYEQLKAIVVPTAPVRSSHAAVAI